MSGTEKILEPLLPSDLHALQRRIVAIGFGSHDLQPRRVNERYSHLLNHPQLVLSCAQEFFRFDTKCLQFSSPFFNQCYHSKDSIKVETPQCHHCVSPKKVVP